MSAQGEDDQSGANQRLEREAQAHDGTPCVAGCRGTGDENVKQRGKELKQSDNAEIERIAGDVIDLPAHRNRDDLRREVHQESRHPIKQESAVAEGEILWRWRGRG